MTPAPGRATNPAEALLRSLFDAAVAAVSPEVCLAKVIARQPRTGRTVLIAVGKAAVPMAAIAVRALDVPVEGLVVTRQGHTHGADRLPASLEIIEAGHPVPDERSMLAAERALALAGELGPKDRLIALVSGGGSALLALPVSGVTLDDKRAMTQALLRSGATIAEMNSVRKHLSAIKGGRLAVAAAPAHVATYIISDVPGDDPSFVASGPTIADTSTLEIAREIVAKYSIDVSPSVAEALRHAENETPPSDALGLAGGDIKLIAVARDALAAATKFMEDRGYKATNLGDHLQAEARYLGAGHAALARRLAADRQARVILSGGETTVRVTNPDGRGGRNLEYLLGLAIALDGAPRIHAIACDTDGIDGTEDNAGAVVAPDTLARAQTLGLDAIESLATNRAYDFFESLGDLVVTGPTRTNVNDFRAILIEPE